jgi:hypothetical protein
MTENIKPRFEVHKLEGKGLRRIAEPNIQRDNKGEPVLDKQGDKKLLGGFEYNDIEVDNGWMVYFPSGSSIHIWTKEEMERQGFLQAPQLVNMETGDVMGTASQTSLKSKSEQVNNRSRTSKVAQI